MRIHKAYLSLGFLSLSAFADHSQPIVDYTDTAFAAPESTEAPRMLPVLDREDSRQLLSKLKSDDNKRLMTLLRDLDSRLPDSIVELLARPNPAAPGGYDVVILLGEAHIKSCETAKAVKEVIGQTEFLGVEAAGSFGSRLTPPLLFDKRSRTISDARGHKKVVPVSSENTDNSEQGDNWSSILKRTNKCASSITEALSSQPRFFVLENLSKMNFIQRTNVAGIGLLVKFLSTGAMGDAVAQEISNDEGDNLRLKPDLLKAEVRLSQQYAAKGKVKTESILGDDRSRMMATSIDTIAKSDDYHTRGNQPIVAITGAMHSPFIKYDLVSRYGFKLIDKRALTDLADR